MSNPLVVCIDDEETVLIGLKHQLQRKFSDIDIEVFDSAEGALEALEGVDEEDFAVIISDYLMPEMKGDEFLIKIHERYPFTKKIMLTGQANAEAIGRVINEGELYRYMSKPWSNEDLFLTVKEAIEIFLKRKEIDRQSKELKSYHSAIEKFLPNDFLRLLEKQKITEVGIGDHLKKDFSILFTDMRGFTSIAENIEPSELVSMLNNYLKKIVPPIRNHNGSVITFIGDAILAVFENSAKDALLCAREMTLIVSELKQNDELFKELKVGIGINYGDTILGIIGNEDRLDATIISDPVNLAARLEGMTKNYNSRIVFSEHFKNKLVEENDFTEGSCRLLDYADVKGKKKPIQVYEDLEHPEDQFKKEYLEEYESIVKLHIEGETSKALNQIIKIKEKTEAKGDAALGYLFQKYKNLVSAAFLKK